MEPSRKPKLTASIATAILITLALLLMMNSELRLSPRGEKKWPPEKHSEIFFETAEEIVPFVRTFSESGDNVTDAADSGDSFGPSDTTSDDLTQTSHDQHDAGRHDGTEAPPTASNRESAMQQKPAEKPSGNRHPNPDDSAAAAARRQQQARKNINDKMQDRFSGAGKDKGKTSDTNGTNPSNGPGGGSGIGMTASVDQRPKSDKRGVIVINVIVLPDGTVESGSARKAARGNSGAAADDSNLVRRCIEAAYKCRFSRRVNETDKRPGTITFRWTDGN